MKFAKIIFAVCSIVFLATQAGASVSDRVKRAKSNKRQAIGARESVSRFEVEVKKRESKNHDTLDEGLADNSKIEG